MLRRIKYQLLIAACCLLLAACWTGPVLAAQPTVHEVARELICPCTDCGKQALDQCPTCGEGQKLRGEIAALLKEGKTKPQIINHFADTYGEHLVGNPRPRGIGVIAPLVPWAGAFVGLGVVLLILRASFAARARREQTRTASASPPTPLPEDPRLSAALRDYDY